jgi:hypothetical protein
MSSKTKTAKKLKASGQGFGTYLKEKREYIAKLNEKRTNHVSEKDLSKGGYPFHFAGPKKGGNNVAR